MIFKCINISGRDIFLKEKVKLIQGGFFLIAFFGVICIKGFEQQIHTMGMIFALLSAFFSGIVYVVINKIGTGDHPVVVVHYFMCIATVIGGVFCIYNWKTPVGVEWVFLLSLGVVGYFGQLFMTKALRSEPTHKIICLKYLEVIFALGIGVFFFLETYTLINVVGIFLVIIGLVLSVFYRKKAKIKDKSCE